MDFILTDSSENVRQILIGYYPTNESRIATHYVELNKIEIDWWGTAQDPGARMDYGVIDTRYGMLSDESEALIFGDRGRGVSYVRYNDLELPSVFDGSGALNLFDILFYSSIYTLDALEKHEQLIQTGSVRKPWIFDGEGQSIAIDYNRWLYFNFITLELNVSVNIKIMGMERPVMGGMKKNATY